MSSNLNSSQQQATTISMHKFIASGGKRFVFTSTGTNSNSNSNSSCSNSSSSMSSSQNSLYNSSNLTKSMVNLATSRALTTTSAPPVADYKAVDSLNAKETPNVRAGLTRKVIESFQANLALGKQVVAGTQQANNSEISTSNHGLAARHQQHFQSKAAAAPQPASAELKIQDELREMRAREAELRSQQRGRKLECEPADSGTGTNESGKNSLSYSSECLYPIKQAIDSFRRLNEQTLGTAKQTRKKLPASGRLAAANGESKARVVEQSISIVEDDDDYVSANRLK